MWIADLYEAILKFIMRAIVSRVYAYQIQRVVDAISMDTYIKIALETDAYDIWQVRERTRKQIIRDAVDELFSGNDPEFDWEIYFTKRLVFERIDAEKLEQGAVERLEQERAEEKERKGEKRKARRYPLRVRSSGKFVERAK